MEQLNHLRLERLEEKLDQALEKIDRIESYIDRQKGGATWAGTILTAVAGLGAFIYYLTSSVFPWLTNKP